MTTRPKKHHYVPVFLSKNFVSDDGFLFARRRRNSGWYPFRSKPEGLFCERGLHEIVTAGGAVDNRVEFAISVIESKSAPVLKRLIGQVESRRPLSLSNDDALILRRFFELQWRRTPEAKRASLPEKARESIFLGVLENARVKFGPAYNHWIDKFASEKNRHLKNALAESTLGEHHELTSAIEMRGLAILIIRKPTKSFIIGSNPVVKFSRINSHVRDTSFEVWLPIASRVAIGLGDGVNQMVLIDQVTDAQVRMINRSLMSQSSIMASSSDVLNASLCEPR